MFRSSTHTHIPRGPCPSSRAASWNSRNAHGDVLSIRLLLPLPILPTVSLPASLHLVPGIPPPPAFSAPLPFLSAPLLSPRRLAPELPLTHLTTLIPRSIHTHPLPASLCADDFPTRIRPSGSLPNTHLPPRIHTNGSPLFTHTKPLFTATHTGTHHPHTTDTRLPLFALCHSRPALALRPLHPHLPLLPPHRRALLPFPRVSVLPRLPHHTHLTATK